jgi:hypothetical protein
VYLFPSRSAKLDSIQVDLLDPDQNNLKNPGIIGKRRKVVRACALDVCNKMVLVTGKRARVRFKL